MNETIMAGMASVVLLGAAAQWLGWRLRLPSILLLLLGGFFAGPDFLDLVNPDAMLGELLLPFVSLSVAILLFEGGLTLHLPELGGSGGVVGRLVTVGALLTWLLAGFAAWLILGFPPAVAALLGATLTVTGPTVVGPLLRQIRPTGAAGSILKWEGILIDPVGAVLAVLVFEAITEGGGIVGGFTGIGRTLVFGGAVGLLGAGFLYTLLRRYWLPDHLHSPTALAVTVGTFWAANALQHEAGLLSVTLMGVVLANQKRVDVRHILEFKENLRVLILSALFVLLAARVRVVDLQQIDMHAVAFLVVLIVVVRPLSTLACSWRSNLSRPDQAFLAMLAPRGVVALSIAAVFSVRLQETYPDAAKQLMPVMFLVVFGTVTFYGLTAGPIARKLGLATAHPQGVLFVGARAWVRQLASTLQEHGVPVLLADTNARRIAFARMDGLSVYHGSVFNERSDEALDLPGIGRLFGVTENDEVNSLSALHYLHLFGRQELYQLPASPSKAKGGDIVAPLRARTLFGEEWTHARILELWRAGHRFKATRFTEQYGEAEWKERYGAGAPLLLAVSDKGKVTVATIDKPLMVTDDTLVVGLVDPERAASIDASA